MKISQKRSTQLCGLAAVFGTGFCHGATLNVPADQPTIQAGIDAALNGDVVLVAPGVYAERIDFHGKTITLQSAQGAAVTVIDGQALGSVITLDSGEGPATVVQGFTIRNGSATFGAGIALTNTAPLIADNIFLNNAQRSGGSGAAIDGFNGSPVVENNEFVGNSCDTQFTSGVMSFVNGSSPRIFNNYIHDNPCRALNMTLPSGAAPVVFNNTIVRNRTGVYIDHRVANASQAYRNNLIAQNGIGLEVVFASTPFDAVWTNNLVFGNTTNFSGTADSTGINGNLGADPRFVDAGNGNFHVAKGSPAIDAGTGNGLVLPGDDFDGQPRVQDGNGDGVATVDIGVYEAAANHAPVANGQTLNATEDNAASVALQATDADGDALAYTIVAQPLHGVLSGSGANRVYTPAANFNGADSFKFAVSDGQASSSVATVSIQVASVNDAPLAVADSAATGRNTALAIAVLSNDSDVDGDALAIKSVSVPVHGSAVIFGATVVYTPARGYVGNDQFTYAISDGHGGTATAAVTVAVLKR